MKPVHLKVLLIIGVLIFLFIGCSAQDYHVDEHTTSKLCEVASFLEDSEFSGDFYLYNGKVKWGPLVDSVFIPTEIIAQIEYSKVEYVARARGIFEFGLFPTKEGEQALILNSEPKNPIITSGNVFPKFRKLENKQCLSLDWYYQTYK